MWQEPFLGIGWDEKGLSNVFFLSQLWEFSLKLIGRDEQRDLGEVAAQQGVALQLAHLHLGLQGGGTPDGRHEEQGPGLPARALNAEVAPASAPCQTKAQGVAQHASRRNPEKDAGGRHVGHHGQEVEGDGIRCLGASFVSHHARVSLTAPGDEHTDWGRWRCRLFYEGWGISLTSGKLGKCITNMNINGVVWCRHSNWHKAGETFSWFLLPWLTPARWFSCTSYSP